MNRNKIFSYEKVLVSYYIYDMLNGYGTFDGYDAQGACDYCLNEAEKFLNSAYNMPNISLWECVENYLEAKDF